jgi:uncharacterized protein DUF4258
VKYNQSLIFRLHALVRMAQRGFDPQDIHKAFEDGKIIENYPDDLPYPSCLVMAWISDRPVHVVAALNNDTQETIVITVYEPDSQIWDNDFTRRK